ncbi:MAG TPA: aldehyde dehydrogenase family protein [Kineosporiaceae bacterium]|nr:aldehyde dehydrogenase family protein [Kineosporiaceae bacterium]
MTTLSTDTSTGGVATHRSSIPTNSSRIVSVDPATGAETGAVTCATPAEVEAAVAAARAALAGWRRTSPGARGAALRAAAADLRADLERLAELHTRDTGKLLADARGAVDVAASLLEEAATVAPLDAGRSLGGDPRAIDVVRREPRGVVAVITPWNDPVPAAAGLLGAALATGNTVVHKPSERSPLIGAALAEVLQRHLPDGVLTVLQGDGAVGEALVSSPGVDVVAHVGSTRAGRRIAEVAGPRATKLLLENGGKDALVVDAGVDPVWAAGQAALGAFVNAGQLCVAVERVVVHADVADAFVAALVEEARAWRPGHPADGSTRLGPLVDARAVEGVLAHVDAAVEAGARVVLGGGRPQDPALAGGCYLEPTVLVDVTPDMAVWTEETFGPVVPVLVAGSFDEALALADEGSYGLAATVLTPSIEHALRAADTLEVGTVKVNAVFGGAPGGSADPRRGSGTGRGYGPDLIGELTVLKAVHLEPAPGA